MLAICRNRCEVQSRDLPAQDECLISLDELQKRHTMRVLERVGGNKSHAAEILGISRATIYQLLGQTRKEADQRWTCVYLASPWR